MQPTLHFVLLCTIGVLHFQDGVFAAEEKPCNAVVADLTKKQLGGISACTKALKFKDAKEKAKKTTCIMKCVLKKEALLDEKGQLTLEQFDKFLAKHFPDSMTEKANSTFRPCVDGALKGMDDTEEFCKDYDPMIKCLLSTFPNESDKSCKQIMADMTKRQLSGITKCIKGMKFKNGKEKAAKMNCIMKCAMENEGLVSKTGDISREQIDEILIREFPSSLLERANATFQPCVEKYAGTMDANPETDPLCATYDPVIKCLISALPNLCPPA
ncbi:hypothetical protein Fcan01_04607 [Folsomia candida]|uniref:Uncharacterized protein n=1 Tax=Folsomia candida TaxID=158441 RepID=A0A226ERU0_FOLCA|nr:hypothetical protein Fcan01_04607 [Folsomia candida]